VVRRGARRRRVGTSVEVLAARARVSPSRPSRARRVCSSSAARRARGQSCCCWSMNEGFFFFAYLRFWGGGGLYWTSVLDVVVRRVCRRAGAGGARAAARRASSSSPWDDVVVLGRGRRSSHRRRPSAAPMFPGSAGYGSRRSELATVERAGDGSRSDRRCECPSRVGRTCHVSSCPAVPAEVARASPLAITALALRSGWKIVCCRRRPSRAPGLPIVPLTVRSQRVRHRPVRQGVIRLTTPSSLTVRRS
jgi:hypothetical protein